MNRSARFGAGLADLGLFFSAKKDDLRKLKQTKAYQNAQLEIHRDRNNLLLQQLQAKQTIPTESQVRGAILRSVIEKYPELKLEMVKSEIDLKKADATSKLRPKSDKSKGTSKNVLGAPTYEDIITSRKKKSEKAQSEWDKSRKKLSQKYIDSAEGNIFALGNDEYSWDEYTKDLEKLGSRPAGYQIPMGVEAEALADSVQKAREGNVDILGALLGGQQQEQPKTDWSYLKK